MRPSKTAPPGRLGYEFLNSIAESSGREEYRRIAPLALLLDGWEKFEGVSSDEELRRFGKAVMLASKLAGDCEGKSGLEPLLSVFSIIDIGKGSPRNMYYRPQRLDFRKGLPLPEEKVEVNAEEYRERINELAEELRGRDFTPEPSAVMAVLETYTTFLPACSGSAVSFYDSARMVAALATALYLYWREEESGATSERPFLLVEGDLSGIQRFIFSITAKGALKHLRARSVYLDLLGWDVVLEIIKRLGLTRASVLYNGGGSFTIIAPNTKRARETLKEIRKELETFLLGKFDGSLYLAIDWLDVSPEEIRDFKGGSLWGELKELLGKRKMRRFLGAIDRFVDTEGYRKSEECELCRKQITRSEFERFVISDPETGEPVLHLCRTCYELWHLGGKLPKTEVFVRTGKDFREDPRKSIELPFSRFHWLESTKLLGSVSFPEGSEVLLRNTLDPRGVPAGYVPIPYVVADYAKLTEDGNIMDLEKLAENSVGADRIAVLKADVDDLGLIFGTGLPKTNPALVANLSRLLDYFFKAYLNSIIREEVSIGRNLPELPTARELGAEKHPGNHGTKANIVVVYVGGDDLFILGAWNEIFNLAFRIRELLREYTGRNPNVTLSAGIGAFPHSYPVERMAIVTEERLETAKDEGKDRICLMGRSIPEDGTFTVSYPWGLYSELWRKYGKPFHIGAGKLALNGKEVSKSALWKLLEFRELYSMDPLGVSWSYLAAYHLSRAGLDKSMKDIVALDVRKYRAREPQEIFWIDGILKILLMAVRR